MATARTKKTRLTKAEAQKYLSNVPEEKAFWSHDGQIFRNIYELERGLSNMSDENYSYHVTTDKNDFSNWVREVIGDVSLAADIEKSNRRLDAAMKVEERIHFLISK